MHNNNSTQKLHSDSDLANKVIVTTLTCNFELPNLCAQTSFQQDVCSIPLAICRHMDKSLFVASVILLVEMKVTKRGGGI